MKIIKMILLVMVSQVIVCLPSSCQVVSGQEGNPIVRMNTDAGDIEIAVVAVDHIGNESDMTKLYAPFGFTAPDAPTGLTLETL